MQGLYHVEINSFYVEIVKVRYRGEGYRVVILRYYSKASGRIIHTEKNRRISDQCFKIWKRYEDK